MKTVKQKEEQVILPGKNMKSIEKKSLQAIKGGVVKMAMYDGGFEPIIGLMP